MTKKEWISYIKNHLKRVDETNKYHPVVIEKTIDTIHSQMFSELYARSKKGVYKYLKDYSQTLSIAGEYPANVAIAITNQDILLDRANGGVFDVQFTNGGATHYCELTTRDLFKRALNARYDTLGVQGHYLVTHYDESLYVPIALAGDDVITYSILPRFSTLDDGDEVLLPVGAEEVMADRVLDTMRLIPPADLMNDNADA
jgi:hypothetical protein